MLHHCGIEGGVEQAGFLISGGNFGGNFCALNLEAQ